MSKKIIEQIHHDINTAYLTKHQECSEILDREQVQSDKYDIAQLGFKSYQTEIAKHEKIEASKKYLDTVKRLKVDYPYKKFITYEQLGSILQKYPLVLSTPDRFIGEIPKNNIKDILNFKLKEVDEGYNVEPSISVYNKENVCDDVTYHIVNNILRCLSYNRNSRRISSGFRKTIQQLCEDIEQPIHAVEWIMKSMGVPSLNSDKLRMSFGVNGLFFVFKEVESVTSKGSNFINIDKAYFTEGSKLNINVGPIVTEQKTPFWILATADQFDIKPSETVVGGCIMEVGEGYLTIPLSDDPIILKPIKEGLIVVTQWGAEASLPEFTNPANN